MQNKFRELWRHTASTVTVVTTANQRQMAGMTISSLASVSLGPPHLLVSFNCQTPSRTSSVIAQTGRLALNLLTATPANILLAKSFAGFRGHDVNPFKEAPHLFDLSGEIPVVKDSLAHMICSVDKVVPVQDHEIIIAIVKNMRINGGESLVYRDREFWTTKKL